MAERLIVGYDPGGNGAHGLAILTVAQAGRPRVVTATLATAEEVATQVEALGPVAALGVDTLTCWSTGVSGFRPADRWLRSQYPEVSNSVASPNSLYGSMGLNGMAVVLATREAHPAALVTETHPKVLYWHLARKRYAWNARSQAMAEELCAWLRCEVEASTEHEWDAAISAYAALLGMEGAWTRDLHALPIRRGERLVAPAGATHYFWPS